MLSRVALLFKGAALRCKPVAPVTISTARSLAAAFHVSASMKDSAAAIARMTDVLKVQLQAEHVRIDDVSGGCGSFFAITVVSPKFAGVSTVKQHRAVNAALEAEIGKMHGLTLKTYTPEAYAALPKK